MLDRRLTRREICRLAAAGSAALVLGKFCPGAGQKNRFSLKYILASSLYGKTKLQEILPEVRKTGAEHIDIWPLHHADQREQVEAMGHERFAALLEKNGIRLGMITRYDLGPFRLKEEMQVLRELGGSLLIAGSRGPRDLKGPELKRAVRKFVEEMKPHVEAAAKLQVRIGIENHSNALIQSPDSLRHLAELAPSPHLGVALAPYHLPQDPALLARLIENLGPGLIHFYAWQYGKGCMKKLPKPEELEQLPGRGQLDFKPLLAALKRINYRGWTEIFMHPVPRGIPILESTRKVTEEINRSRNYLEACLREIA
jgi:sugar phosphate isomerase/epimerase